MTTDTLAAEPVIVADPKIDPDRFMLEGIDTSEKPLFTVSEVAKFFFARSAHWMRWRERSFFFMLGGDPKCEHHEMKKKMILREDESGKKKRVAKSVPDSWVKNGVCTRCGATEVGARRTGEGARTYSLSDIEKIAHALARRNAITGTQLRNTLSLVANEARVWGFI